MGIHYSLPPSLTWQAKAKGHRGRSQAASLSSGLRAPEVARPHLGHCGFMAPGDVKAFAETRDAAGEALPLFWQVPPPRLLPRLRQLLSSGISREWRLERTCMLRTAMGGGPGGQPSSHPGLTFPGCPERSADPTEGCLSEPLVEWLSCRGTWGRLGGVSQSVLRGTRFHRVLIHLICDS